MSDKRLKYLKIAGITLLVVLYLYFLIFNQLQHRAILKEEEKGLIEVNQAYEKKLEGLDNTEEILIYLEEEAVLVEEKLKHDLRDGAFLVKLTEKITKEKIIMGSYSISPVQDFQSFYALPGKITLVGNYRGVMNVLNYMEYQPNMTQIQDLTIKYLEEDEIEIYYGSGEDFGLLTESILVERDPATVLPGESPYEEVQITRAVEVNLEELFSGRVIAECTYVLYTIPTPQAKIELNNIQNWRTGNLNPFQ